MKQKVVLISNKTETKVIDIENKTVVTTGEREGVMNETGVWD